MNTRIIYVPCRIIKKIKEICTNIDRHIKNIYKEKITDFFTSLNDHKKKIRMDTNQYIIHRHFLLSTIMEINTILMKHKAKFMFDLSSDMYEDIRNKIKSHNNFLKEKYNHEVAHGERQYINDLIYKHTPDKRLLSRLPKASTIGHVFTLNNS